MARSREVFVGALQGGKQVSRKAMYQALEAADISATGQRGLHVLWWLAKEGLLCFGAREGKQQTFALLDEWVAYAKSLERDEADEAMAELARRYFTSRGPATVQDFTWWSGLAASNAMAALEMAMPGLDRQVIDGQTYWLSSLMPTVRNASPAAHLLPAFDEYTVAYKNRSAVLDLLSAKRTISGNGIFNPLMVLNRQVVGTWKRTLQKGSVVITQRPFNSLKKVEKHAFTEAARRYGAFLEVPVVLAVVRPAKHPLLSLRHRPAGAAEAGVRRVLGVELAALLHCAAHNRRWPIRYPPFKEADMNQKTKPRLTFPVLGLALLLAAGTACKPADKNVQATPGTTSSSSAAAKLGPPLQRSQSGPAAQTPAAGSPTFSITPPPAAGKAMVTPDKMPEVVAKVNGQSIKKDDLLKGAQVVRMRMAQMGQPVALTPEVYRQVLDELIGITLLQQDAKAQGVAPSEQELDQQVAARKKQFPSPEVYKKALKETGLTEALLRQQTRDQIAVQKYVETKLIPGVAISDQATKDFYEKNKDQIHSPERMHLRHILIGVNTKGAPADKEKARAKAEDLLKQIQGGADFAKLAQANSDDTGSKVNGGDLGWVSPGQTVPTFEKAAMALKPNQVSPVVESPFGFHIIQLLERQASAAVPYEEVKDRIGMMLKQKQTQELVQARIKELRGKAKVEVFI